MISNDIRIAIIGCGAVSELAHLPASKAIHGGRITTLVDTNQQRRETLAEKFGIEHTAVDVAGCMDFFDAAILALPHALHASVAVQLLSHGKAVLVEKPMANTTTECNAMIQAAAQTNTILAVGLIRRFLWAHRFVKTVIENGTLGPIRSFDFAEGAVYSWPVASDFFFRKETAGGGVLIDTGAHTLDCLLHWLGDFVQVNYFDDAEGGVEANCVLKLDMQNGASGKIELSRTRNLRNTAIIESERGCLEVALGWNFLKWSLLDQPYLIEAPVIDRARPGEQQDYLRLIADQMQDWVDAIRLGRQPAVSGRCGIASIGLIEKCYARRQSLEFSWDQPNAAI